MHRLLPAAVAAAMFVPVDAEACGGFFCSSVPIDQSKERIVFAIDKENERVTTHVQIFYSGSAEDFAWVVPVPSVPDVGLSTDELFNQLEWRTAPSFNLTMEEEGECEWDMMLESDMDESNGASPPSSPTAGAGGGVTVVEEAQVGPYDQVTLQASSTGALLDWLDANDYDLPAEIGESLAPYVDEKSYFVALKLGNDRDAGDIAPISMTYDGDAAMIPIVLTAIAATPDMRLQPYVFGDHRAVPDNYLHVKINEAAIDWLGWGSNYDDVITQAANEAGGQAFATDFAGSTEGLQGMLWWEGRFDLTRLRSVSDPSAYVDTMMSQGFRGTPAVQNIMREFIPMPDAAVTAGVEERDFYNCLECYPEYVALVDFDADAMTDALDETIVTPLREAEALFTDHPYLTRMTSSMSSDEMTLDPYFVQNPSMEEVSNIRMATLIMECGDGIRTSEANRRIVLEDGREILVPPDTWFWETGTSYVDFVEDLGNNAALVIEKTSASGGAQVLSEFNASVDEAIDDHNARVRELLGIEEDPEAKGCGCASTGAPGVAWTFALLLLGLGRRRD